MVASREPLAVGNGAITTGKTLKKNTTETASAALRHLVLLKPTDDKPAELAKCLGYNAVQNKMLKGRAHTLHMSLAVRFHNDILAPDRETVLNELLEGNDPDSDRPWNLALLLAEGSSGLILHVLLDPGQFLEGSSKYSFCRVRAFIALLLEIEPTLLEEFDKSRRTPLHCMIFSSSSEELESISSRVPNSSKEAIITYMCTKDGFPSRARRLYQQEKEKKVSKRNGHRERRMVSPPPYQTDSDPDSMDPETDSMGQPETSPCTIFGGACAGPDEDGKLCCLRDCGIALKSALKSLEEVAAMDSGLRFHAVHAAITEDIAFPQTVVDALSSCFYELDSFGRSCLHLAVSMPFTNTKIQWAKSLARMCPRLLAEASAQDDPLDMLDVPPLSSAMDERLVALEDDLKLYCLASFEDSELCRGFMYTETNEKEIDFPLKDMIISKKTLDSLCQHFRPDRHLKSVSVENVQIEWDQTSKPYLDTQEWGCAGNSDLYLVFNWLRQTQSVRKIFQVSVNDFDDQSSDNVWRRHSDKAIVECLKGFNVETWDWQRPDIPCSAIYEAAGDSVKTLYLYSSGLDAVLESWASPGGLPRLKKLERIYLCAGQGLESRDHAHKSAVEFKAAIEKNYAQVNGRKLEAVEFAMLQTYDHRTTDDGTGTNSANEHEANEWLRSMDQFAAFMDQIGKTGHGTVMAWYIRRMCPRVKLCVAKLDPVIPALPTADDKVTFTVESVIKAIRWAISKKVDVISMSWAIDDNVPSEIKKSLGRAIRAAIDSNILIFCANPDKGAEYGNNLTYPYHLEKEHIFCIGAAGRNGKRWDWIDAKDKSCTYLLPGVDLDIHVESKQPALSVINQPTCLPSQDVAPVSRILRERCKQSGSSLACALASGLAAMILHCSRVAGASSKEIDYLRTYDGMKSALDSLYPDNGASAAAAGEGQWLPVSSLPSARSFAHISSTDKKRDALLERVNKFVENMPDDYIMTVPSNGRVTRTPTLNSSI
ncbi:hypothetical protein SEUCBS139899_008849 [Sporothrix eucalyptigena]|uniref:Peptidase S8/S53 domain-containing protein n=1 Tax=Sporothrix eucalyptigena TaxID=1812306 RepID=A0ABP0ARY4_9PEZI